MVRNKLGAALQIVLRYENLLTPEVKSLFIANEQAQIWELIMMYGGSLSDILEGMDMEIYDLGGGFAQVFISKFAIGDLSDKPSVVFLNTPIIMKFISVGLGNICAAGLATQGGNFTVTGENVLLGVVDSGIYYQHPDFRKDDGTTRILYLWDQDLPGTPPEGFSGGREFTSEQINVALSLPTQEEQLERVPSIDVLGHGTAITGIAAGNGRGSVGRINMGVAPDAKLIIVKADKQLGLGERWIRDIDVMRGIKYIIDKAAALDLPVVILLGCGQSLNNHSGEEALDLYITAIARSTRCNFVVGTGNEGDRGGHVSGKLAQQEEIDNQLLIEDNLRSYGVCIWSSLSDDFELVIQSPTGEETEALGILTPNRAYLFDNTAVLVNFTETLINISNRFIVIYFQAQGQGSIDNGLWHLTLRGKKIVEGNYHMWGSIVSQRDNRTRFLNPTLDTTLTSPSTVRGVTSVATYNGQTGQLAVSSGRGYTLIERIKPDIAAPGINITVPSNEQGVLYTMLSGSSVAASFVAGAYLILLSYGIYQLGNPNLFGDVLKSYLIRNARRPIQNAPYPNNRWGYGTLCVEAALNDMREVATQTS